MALAEEMSKNLPRNEGLEGRPGVLVAMVSRDVIVLTKVVRTLCPHKVLLFSTPFAEARGWTMSATKVLLHLKQSRPELLEDFEAFTLPDAALAEKLDRYQASVAMGVRDAAARNRDLVFDTTMGQSIFHVIGFDRLRELGAAHGVPISAVYCDADTGTILRSRDKSGAIQFDSQPIRFRYRPGDELFERFMAYGVQPRGGSRLWPSADEAGDQETYCELYDALCASAPLRALFHSYWLKLRDWKQREQSANSDAAKDLDALIARQLERFAKTVVSGTGNPKHAVLVVNDLSRVLDQALSRSQSNAPWLDLYHADKDLAGLKRGLRETAMRFPRQLLPARKDGKKRHELGLALNKLIVPFILEIRRHILATYPITEFDPTAFTGRDHAAFLAHAVSELKIADNLKTFLLASKTKIPDLFEACVGAALTRAAENQADHAVSAVFQNVSFFRNDSSIAEIDTMVLFENADVAIVEAKTHCGNAELKKIEANIKGARDFSGAYTNYQLIYPLTAGDLAEFVDENNAVKSRWIKLGMRDVANWQQYLIRLTHSPDQRILPLDHLDTVMRRNKHG